MKVEVSYDERFPVFEVEKRGANNPASGMWMEMDLDQELIERSIAAMKEFYYVQETLGRLYRAKRREN
jgi:hypothetical protein